MPASNNNISNTDKSKPSGSSSKKKSGSKKHSSSTSRAAVSTDVSNEALPLVRAVDDRDIHPRNILTGFYGARGERIRHVVQDGCLQMPRDALVYMEEITRLGIGRTRTTTANNNNHNNDDDSAPAVTSKTPSTYALPGLDFVLRPCLDPKLENLTVTELMIEKIMIPKNAPPKSDDAEGGMKGEDQPPVEPEMMKISRCAASNRVIRRYNIATSSGALSSKSGAERIRGGGEEEQQEEAKEPDVKEGNATDMDVDESQEGNVLQEPVIAMTELESTESSIGIEQATARPIQDAETSQQQQQQPTMAPATTTEEEQPSDLAVSFVETPGATMGLNDGPSTTTDEEPVPMELEESAVTVQHSQPIPATTNESSTVRAIDADSSLSTTVVVVSEDTTNQLQAGESIPVGNVLPTPGDANKLESVSNEAESLAEKDAALSATSVESPANVDSDPSVPTSVASALTEEFTSGVAASTDAATLVRLQQQEEQRTQQPTNDIDAVASTQSSNPTDHSNPTAPVSMSPTILASISSTVDPGTSTPSASVQQQNPAPSQQALETSAVPSPPSNTTAATTTATITQQLQSKPPGVISSATPMPATSSIPTESVAHEPAFVPSTSNAHPSMPTLDVKPTADKVPSTDPTPQSKEGTLEKPVKEEHKPDSSERPIKEDRKLESEVVEEQAVPPARALKSKPDPQWEQHKPAPSDEAVTPQDQSSPRPDWYKKDEVSDIERTMLPEWFDASAPHRTPESYIMAREKVIEMSDAMGNRNVTNSMIRRAVVGDAGSLQRLRNLLVHWGIVNEDAINDSAPTPASLRSELKTPKRFNDELRGDLIVAVVQQARRRKLNDDNMDYDSPSSPSFVPIDWDEVAKTVGHGASADDCQRNFMATPLKDSSSSTWTTSDRPITPDGTTQVQSQQAPSDATSTSKEAIRREFIHELVERTDPVVLNKVVAAAMEATSGNLQESQAATLLGLQMTRAVEIARGHEVDLAVRLSKLIDTRMEKLENRMVMIDDIEGILEAEKMALELERRDLYTARCRHWFGGA